MKILVTGGAGYIGSHVVSLLKQKGHTVLVLDNLSTGHFDLVCPKWVSEDEFFIGDLLQSGDLQKIFRAHQIHAVMHFAAKASVPESLEKPFDYYQNNVVGSLNLLQAMRKASVRKFIFSSTAAVYGVNPNARPLVEDDACRPMNPYGLSKLMVEQILEDMAKASDMASVCLRYFNAAGADVDQNLGEWHEHETHLIPRILQAAAKAKAAGTAAQVPVYGRDYKTLDGTCVRDFVHVRDLAQAHCLALEALDNARNLHSSHWVFNLGSSQGYSVLEVIRAAADITGIFIEPMFEAPRPGDPGILVAGSDKIQKTLGWKPVHSSLHDILQSAWAWEQKRQAFYGRKKP